ncbi:lysozyme inhibitor LprI family protein [Rahnella victoriana]|uniref:lysozyme inhibitor LprI family protein n=1 Tax=Rahnella victoriana TaxID=1510570 RepID=UPI001E630F74|nr:lysozyme inhibitor LprI family protein [Rahnella victoriana]UHM89769.1 hypothetical protein J9880_15850 [Rahnella victoriana]
MKSAWLAGLLCGLTPLAYGASFDCEKASGFIELTICSTPSLSDMDSQLSKLYGQVLEQQPQNKALLRKSQLSWLKDVRGKATTIQTLQSAYQARILDLHTLLGDTAQPTTQQTAAITEVSQHPATTTLPPAPVKSDLQLKAEAGDPQAQVEWGIKLSEGDAQQKREAITWLEKSAENKNTSAIQRLGFLYTYGKGVTQDVSKGLSLTRQAAEANDANAQIDLGYDYANGIGVEKDYQQSLAWYEKAKQNGSPLADQNIKAAKYHIDEEEKYKNGFTAIITCGPVTSAGYVDNCFNDSDLKVTNNHITTLYNMNSGNYPSQAGEAYSDGLHIKLTENFTLFAQNSMDNDVLTVKIIKNSDGTVVYQDQASKYGVVKVTN